MKECCKNCKHCIRVGQLANSTKDGWRWYSMCAVFIDHKDTDRYGIIVADNDRCELYEEKNKK